MSFGLIGTLRALHPRLVFVRKSSRLSSMVDRLTLFQSIGLSEQKSQETIKNEGLAKRLEAIVTEVRSI